jgi:hypothetical protein
MARRRKKELAPGEVAWVRPGGGRGIEETRNVD